MKKKIIALCICVMMLTVAVAGGTLAYFTDEAAQTNTFTAGKVDITLTESVVEEDENGNLVSTGERTSENQEYKLFPGQTVTKDPTISLASDSEKAYVAAVLTVRDEDGDIEALIGTGYENLLGINAILSGGFVQENAAMKTAHPLSGGALPVYGDDSYSLYQTADKSAGVYTFYFFAEEEQSAGDSVLIFDTISIPADWDNEEMAKLDALTLEIQAYAAQAHGFDSCFDAMCAAFPEVFDFGEE